MKGKKMGQHGGGHKVAQDKDYISKVSQADFDAFKAIPDMTKAKFVASIKHLKSVGPDGKPDGKSVQISGDMVLAPARYGFADKAAAQKWIDDIELVK